MDDIDFFPADDLNEHLHITKALEKSPVINGNLYPSGLGRLAEASGGDEDTVSRPGLPPDQSGGGSLRPRHEVPA